MEMLLAEIKTGDQVKEEFSITEKAISLFSELTNDYAPVHSNESFAKKKGFNGPIAHGLLTSSFISGLLGDKLPGKHSVINEISLKYHEPVYAGQTIEVVVTVQRVIESVRAVYLEIKIFEKSTLLKVVSGRAICSFPKV